MGQIEQVIQHDWVYLSSIAVIVLAWMGWASVTIISNAKKITELVTGMGHAERMAEHHARRASASNKWLTKAMNVLNRNMIRIAIEAGMADAKEIECPPDPPEDIIE